MSYILNSAGLGQSSWTKSYFKFKKREHEENMSLIEEMKGNLPIPVYPTSALAKHLSEKGIKIDANTELSITQVFESGDTGGIMCHVLEVNGEVIIVSLTHLRVKPGHPLSKKIQSYQKNRKRHICFGLKDTVVQP